MRFIIKGGRVHSGRGQVYEGADILIEGDTITQIGLAEAMETTIEADCVLDAAGLDIFPGFIDPLTIMGCNDGRMYDNNESTDPLTPNLKVKYAVEYQHLIAQKFYEMGITHVGIGTWNTNLLGGLMSVYKTFGEKAHEMLVRDSCIMTGSVTSLVKQTHTEKKRPPMTKMRMFQMLEDLFRQAEIYNPTPGSAPDPKKAVVQKVLEGEIPLIMAANLATEVAGLLDLFKNRRQVKLTIACAYQAWKYADAIHKAGISLILGDQNVHGPFNDDLRTDKLIEMAAEGVEISNSFSSDSRFAGKSMYLWSAMKMYKAGMDAEAVIKTMTCNPAQVLGMEKELGTIEVGKKASLSIWRGHPIKTFDAHICRTMIDGQNIYGEGLSC